MKDKDIHLVEGILAIRDVNGEEHLISELPMSAFETFYRAWTAIMIIGSEAEVVMGDNAVDFASLYVTNPNFREQAILSLKVLGFDDPACQLTPRQMKSLLYMHEVLDSEGKPVLDQNGNPVNGAGLVFQLHQTSPKVLVQTVPNPTPGRKTTSKGSQSLIKRVSSFVKRWATSTWVTVCLSAISCGLVPSLLTLA